MPSKTNDVFCGDCDRLLLYHPALGHYICPVCWDGKEQLQKQADFDVEPYTGNDGL